MSSAITTQVVGSATDFWTKMLTSVDQELTFSSGNHDADYKVAKASIAFNDTLSEKLKALSKDNQLSLFVLFTAAVKVLLYRTTQTERLVVGTPVHEGIGSDINTGVPLFDEISETTRLSDFVFACKSTIVDAYQHQHLSFQPALRQLPNAHVNLFQVVVALDTIHGPEAGEHLFHAQASELLFGFTQKSDCIVCNLTYLSSAFTSSLEAENFLDWLVNICSEFARDISQPISAISLLNAAQEQRLITALDLNRELDDLEQYQAISEVMSARLRTNPKRTVLACEDRCYTRGALLEAINRCAQSLLDNGVAKGDVIAVLIPESDRQVVTMLAIWRAGAVYLPIDNQLPSDRIEYILTDSAPAVVVADSDAGFNECQLPVETLWYQNLIDSTTSIGHQWPTLSPSAPAYIIYTSGSTGKPKGVKVPHRGLANLIRHFDANLETLATDRYLQFASMAFDAAVWETVMGLFQDGEGLYLYPQSEKADRSRFVDFIARHKITVTTLPPPLITQFQPQALPSLRRLIVAGSKCPVSVAEQWSQRVDFINAYGPTETTVCATMWPYRDDEMLPNSVPIGRAVKNCRVYILNAGLRLQPLGCTGEICVGGSNLALEYLNLSELTQQRFVDNPYVVGEKLYRTGDLGRWTSHGVIEFIGRTDEQIKVRGIRVESGEIESTLLRHDLVGQAYVQLRTWSGNTGQSAGQDEALCAYITLADTAVQQAKIDPLISAALEQHLRAFLPEYMIPNFFIIVPRFEVNVRDKIDAASLPSPQHLLSTENIAPPETSTQEAVLAVWSELLQLNTSQISVDANFFTLGGNSLNATEMASRIHQKLNVALELFEIFNATTIRELSTIIDSKSVTKHVGIPNAQRKSSYELSSAQARLYFLHQLAPQSTSYNLPSLHLFDGALDYVRIEKALRQLIERHASLRTRFVHAESELGVDSFLMEEGAANIVQVIDTEFELPIEYSSISDFNVATDTLAEAAYEIMGLCIRPFDLSKAPLIRLHVVKISTNKHLLITDAHHIIADGVSMGILIRDFMALYAGEELVPLAHQYTDFSEWQNQQIHSNAYQQYEKYWTSLLTADVPRLRIASDHPRPPVMTFDGDFVELTLDPNLSRQIERFTQTHDLTHYMFFLAVFNILLHKYSDSEDVTVGTGVAGRSHSDLKNLIGMFVNTLIMRNSPKGGLSVSNFLQQVRENSLKAFDNQLVQFDDLVNKLSYERDTSRNPVFDYLLVVQNFDMPTMNLDGLRISSLPQPHRTSKFDLTVFVSQTPQGQFQILFEYYTAIFKRATIRRWSQQFHYLIQQVLTTPEAEIRELALIKPEFEQQWLTHTGVHQPAPLPVSGEAVITPETPFVDLFEHQVLARPYQAAVVYDGRHYSYAYLNEEANKLAHFLLSEHKVQPEQPVGLLIDHSHWQMIAMLGILKAGAVYLPIETSIPRERMRHIIEDSNIQIMLSTSGHAEVVNRLLWLASGLTAYVLLDAESAYRQRESTHNSLGDKELWNYIVDQSVDDITGGGWVSSYTGLPFTRQEMDEYGDNVLYKLKPLLTPNTRILEIGCASGISMYRLAPHICHYVGTDLSDKTIEQNRRLVVEKGITNISLHACAAIDIDTLDENEFDIVIINSVIQAFDGHNYLREVVEKCTDKMRDTGYLFIGDVMDQDLHQDFVADLTRYKMSGLSKIPFVIPDNVDARGFVTKTDQSSELSVSRHFFEDLLYDVTGLKTVNFSEKIGELRNELTEYRYDALFTFNRSDSSVPTTPRHKHQYDRRDLVGHSADNPDQNRGFRPDGSQLLYTLFTSGSTGTPKGVMIENRSLVSFIRAIQESLETTIDHSDRFLVHTNQSFDASMIELFVPLAYGATCVVAKKSDFVNIEALTELMLKEKVTACWMPVALLPHMARLMRDSELAVSLNKLITGAEAVKSSILRDCYALNKAMKILNVYGPTEATVYATSYLWSPEYDASIADLHYDPNFPIGTVRPDAQVLLLNSEMQQVPPGVVGEVYIGGSGVMRGYLNRDTLSRRVLVSHPYKPDETVYKTGDLARFDEAGCIHFVGREDSQIKLRGMRVELGEVEQQLLLHPQIGQAYALIENPSDPYICVYYTSLGQRDDLHKNDVLEDSELQTFLASRLPSYMVPAYYIKLDAVPLRISGKVDYDALRRHGMAVRAQRSSLSEAALTTAQLKMAQIWAEVLDTPAVKIGLDSDFFSLGGHSLKATRLVSLIKREFKTNMPLAVVFETPTIRSLTEYCERQEAIEYLEIKPVAVQDHYELSSSQKSMFIVQSITKGSTAYNMPSLIRVRGAFDVARADRVFKQLLARHEILRTSYAMVDNELRQIVHDNVAFETQYQKVKEGGSIQDYLSDFIRPFDLQEAPMIRARVIEVADDTVGDISESFLFVDMNHIASDGSSMTVFIEEFASLYNGYELQPLSLQYRDFAHWQNKALTSKEVKLQEAYWRKNLALPLPKFALPLDFERPAIQSFQGDQTAVVFPRELVERLKSVAQSHEATLFMLLLSAAFIFLNKITSDKDIIIGTSLAGRDHADLEKIMGMFVNTLPLRNQIDEAMTISEFIKMVRQNTIEAFDNKQVQFERLVDLLKVQRDPSRNPIFDVRFDVHNNEQPKIELNGLDVLDYEPEFKTSKFDLTFDVFTRGDTLLVRLEYSTALFKPETIQDFLRQYRLITEYVVNHPEHTIGQLDTLSLNSSSLRDDSGVEFDFMESSVQPVTAVRIDSQPTSKEGI